MLLKKDLFGEIRAICDGNERLIERDTRSAAVWVRWLARYLLRREARALAALQGFERVPQLVWADEHTLRRRYLEGEPLQKIRTRDPAYFRSAAKLLRRMHRRGVVHNDLAKEPNLLVLQDGGPAVIDFQLAWFSSRRGKLFRLLGYEDVRHLLKHKRSYCEAHLTARERRILANPSLGSRLFRNTFKPVYMLITRRLLGWSDREGAGNRGDTPH